MARYTEEQYRAKKEELMEKCYECFADQGLHGTGIRKLGEYCGCNPAVFYTYFKDLDDLIVQSTAYCMSKIEDDFMEIAPKNPADVDRFIDEVPYWTARKHGKKYRLMYQVYTHPKYLEYGKEFFKGVDKRYRAYARKLAPLIGVPEEVLRGMIFITVRASVHYALFEDEEYLNDQMQLVRMGVKMLQKTAAKEKIDALKQTEEYTKEQMETTIETN